MSSSAIFVRNSTDEFIGQAVSSLEGLPDKLIVVNYTRDQKVLGSTSNNVHVFTMKCEHHKFTGFAKYLHERKKAAVIKFQHNSTKNDILYMLPPTNLSVLTEVICVLNSDILIKNNITVGNSSGNKPVTKHIRAPSVKSSVDTSANKQGGGFLSNLLSKVEADTSSRKNMKKTPLIKKDVLTAVEELQARVREALHSLEEDNNKTEVAFEPMEPEQRYLVHEVVDDFENLIGQSTGEDIERHVVVYKKGFEPQEEEVIVQEARSMSSRAPKKKSGVVAPNPPVNLIKVHTVKRDRRTIEEYQIEKKRKIEE